MLFTLLTSFFPAALAWRPLLDPIDLHDQWLWLMLPLAFAIALVYKTLKVPHLDQLWPQTFRLTVLIIVVAVLTAASLWAIVEIA